MHSLEAAFGLVKRNAWFGGSIWFGKEECMVWRQHEKVMETAEEEEWSLALKVSLHFHMVWSGPKGVRSRGTFFSDCFLFKLIFSLKCLQLKRTFA